MYNEEDILVQQIINFRKKLYQKSLFRGGILFTILILSSFIIFNVLEYYGQFNSIIRSIFFFTFIGIALFALVKYLIIPSYYYINRNKTLNDIRTAELMGRGFPNVKDKLVNYLQLLQQADGNELAIEALHQKRSELKNVSFIKSIKFDEIYKYLKYSTIPIIVLFAILLVSPAIFSEGATRIINYQKVFVSAAPFDFIIKNTSLKAFQGEDLQLDVTLEGKALPEHVYVVYNGRKIKLESLDKQQYLHIFKNLQSSLTFNLEASGYSSHSFTIDVVQKPVLTNLTVLLDYPAHTKKKNETVDNVGTFTVPEGTRITWDIAAKQTDTAVISFGSQVSKINKAFTSSSFTFSKTVMAPTAYTISLVKAGVEKDSKVNFDIDVIKDAYPSINVEAVVDTLLFKEVSLGGSLKDDYGFSKLHLIYSITDEKAHTIANRAVPIKIDPSNYSQNIYFYWNIDTLHLKPGQALSYYLQVWDNDGVNGPKSAKSQVSQVKVPDLKTIESQIEQSTQQTEQQLNNSMSQNMELQKEFDKLQNKIKGKKNLDWQDKKAIEDFMKKHNSLEEEINKLNELNEQLNKKQEKFSEEDLRIAEKAQQLQDLIKNIMDEETKKLWDELQKLLQEKNKDQQIQELLQKINKQDESMEKELDRAMEFYKQLQFDRKLEENIQQLKELSEKQKELSEKSADKQSDPQDLNKQQEDLNKEFNQIKQELQEMKELNKTLENKRDLEQLQLEQMEKEVEQKMQEAKEELNKNDKKDAQKKQKEASGKMQEMADKMQKMQQDGEQKQHEENMDDLRQILENLLKLSFDQEELMKNLKSVNKSDPKYMQYSQQQLKLRDDAKIIEDSLFALSKRVHEIESFISKEVEDMKYSMDESSKLIKRREPYFASSKQQAAMTSMNNLALMLDDVLKSMQEKSQQMNQNSKGGGGSCKKPGSGQGQGKKSGNKPSVGQMQQQLNQQMQQLLNGGKSGSQMSEQLAKMAAQQEKIRRAVQELENLRKQQGGKPSNEEGKGEKPGHDGKNGPGGNGGSGGDAEKMMKEMDKIEEEIVNKRISPELIKRQKELTTRLLEFEKAVRDRELEEKRESNTGKELDRPVPPSLQKYFKEKSKVTEMIRTVPPSLNPYYKKKMDDFIQNLNP